jgi:tellurite resistance protein
MSSARKAMASWLGLLAQSGVLDEVQEAGEAVAAYVVGHDRVTELSHWFAEQDEDTRRRERRAVIELCILMAHADRTVDPEERALLRELVASSGLEEPVQDELIGAVHSPPALDAIEMRLTHPVLRELMLALAWELAMADGRIHGDETAFYSQLADRLSIDPKRAESIRDSIADRIV